MLEKDQSQIKLKQEHQEIAKKKEYKRGEVPAYLVKFRQQEESERVKT